MHIFFLSLSLSLAAKFMAVISAIIAVLTSNVKVILVVIGDLSYVGDNESAAMSEFAYYQQQLRKSDKKPN